MAYSLGEMQSVAQNMFSAYASVAASMMLYRSMANDIIPEPVKNFFYNTLGQYIMQLVRRFFPEQTHMTVIVDEQTGIYRNQIYEAAEIYLRPKINPKTERLKANKSQKQKSINISMEKEEEVIDEFNGFEVKWQFVLIEPDGEKNKYRHQPDKRYFELTFERKHKETVVSEYLPFILKKAKEFKDNDKTVKLFTRDCYLDSDDDEGGNGNGTWGCVNFDHPVTFDKLAMDPKKKKEIVDDLDRFVRRKEYYKKVGKAWKRGYLLYGPPGTGKSSMIAAIANYLKFDVYDLELSSLYSNSDLKRVLLGTNNRSIIVIEDIDCSAQTHDRDADSSSSSDDSISDTKLTLSGLLNFMDGLWSTCGDERIVIFTTNHKDKLDPALLRPGRMDMHIHMGYCTPEGFDVLASNYLGVHDHERLFPEIKQLIKEVDATPAEIAEHLMRNEDRELALEGVLGLLKEKQHVKAAMVVAEKNVKEKVSERSENVESEVKEKKKKKKRFGGFLRSLTSSRRRTSKEIEK